MNGFRRGRGRRSAHPSGAVVAVLVLALAASLSACSRGTDGAATAPGSTEPLDPSKRSVVALCEYPDNAAPRIVLVETVDGLVVSRTESPEAGSYTSADGDFEAGEFAFGGGRYTLTLPKPPAYECNRRPGYFSGDLRSVPFLFDHDGDRVPGYVTVLRAGEFGISIFQDTPPPPPGAPPRYGAVDAAFRPGTSELHFLSETGDCTTAPDRTVRVFGPKGKDAPLVTFTVPCAAPGGRTLAFSSDGRVWVREADGSLRGDAGATAPAEVAVIDAPEGSLDPSALPEGVEGTPIGTPPVVIGEEGTGRQAFVTRGDDGACRLWIVDAAGGEPRKLSTLDGCFEPLAFRRMNAS